MDITLKIIAWYQTHKRDLPWRHTSDPYRIWVSEVILQQTRVNQGMSYYLRFLERFPDVHSLSAASEQEVLLLWQGLGYYSRARNMHAGAKQVVESYNGKFPDSYEKLLTLKGVGPYTAAAIASFAFGIPHAAIDGNVNRVIARLYAVDEPVNTSRGQNKITSLTYELLDQDDPGTFNQAMMEFGALQCVARQPHCEACPLKEVCMAFQQGKAEDYPQKIKKKKPRERHLNYLVMKEQDSDAVWLQQRTNASDIWYNLYEFPVIETRAPIDADQLVNSKEFEQIVGEHSLNYVRRLEVKKHQLSHQTLIACFWEVNMKPAIGVSATSDLVREQPANLEIYPLPRLISSFAEAYFEIK